MRWLVVLVMLASGASSYWLFITAKRELAPMEDRGVIIMPVRAPDGSTLEYTARYLDALDAIAATYPEFDRRFMFMGGGQVSTASAVLRTVDWNDRTLSDAGAGAVAAAQGVGAAGHQRVPDHAAQPGPGLPRAADQLRHRQRRQLRQHGARRRRQLIAEMAKNPGIVQLDIDLQLNKPEIFMEVDRERAADMGVSVDAVARTVETMLGGRVVTRYKRDAEQYDVMVQTATSGRTTPEDIEKLFVRGRNDTMVPLSTLVKVREAVSPRELNHFNQRRSVTITANLAPDYALGEALQFMDETAARVLPAGYATELNGVSREFKASSGALGVVFVLALLFIFLVLAAQFESFIDPFVILLVGALVDGGRAGRAAAVGRHAQRVLADRPDHAGRPDHQARHPDRRVQQPAAPAGPRGARRGDRGRQPAPAADPDDHRRDGAGRAAAGAGHRRRCREPAADRLGHRRRHEPSARC